LATAASPVERRDDDGDVTAGRRDGVVRANSNDDKTASNKKYSEKQKINRKTIKNQEKDNKLTGMPSQKPKRVFTCKGRNPLGELVGN